MSKLIRAGFRRYVRSYVFWLSVIVTLGVAIVCGISARQFSYDAFYFMIILIANAVMISWIVGNEEGIRNKIITGHTKGNIFLSELILGIVASVVIYLFFAMVFLGINSYIIGHAPNGVAIKIFLCGLVASACTAAILVTISLLISHRAIIAIVNILLILALVFATQTIDGILRRPEYWEEYDYEYTEIIDGEGNVHLGMSAIEGSMHLVENPNYIESPARDVLSVIGYLSPFTTICKSGDITYGWFGYNMQVSSNSINNSHTIWDNEADFSVTKEENTSLNLTLIFTSMELIAISFAGYFFFRKKELK